MPIEEREIWACALHIIKRYGDVARFHAAQRADELLEAGDGDGAHIWGRILHRIQELESDDATKQ